jgi:hypothetical protein
MGTVVRKSTNLRKAMNQAIVDCSKLVAKVGYFPSAKYPDGTPIAYIAAIQEHGASSQGLTIPPRPTMRPTIDEQGQKWKGQLVQGMNSVMVGKRDTRAVLELVSLQAAGDVRKTITELQAPSLSKVTLLARKFKRMGGKITGVTQIYRFIGQVKKDPNIDTCDVSNKPLNDTGALLAHLSNVVEAA